MLVINWMSQPAITIDADAPIADAIKILQKHQIHMLPVMQNGQLVGVVTERDFKGAATCDVISENRQENSILPSGIKVSKIMALHPVTVSYDYTLEETVEKFLVYNISGLPVVNQQRKVIGVITKSDFFQLILVLTGFGKKGLQLGIELEDRAGCLKEITDIIREYGGRIASIFSTHERADKGNRRLYIRIFDIDQPSLLHLKEVLRKRAILLYIVDHNGKKREIF